MGRKTVFTHASIVTENEIIQNGYLLIAGGKIAAIGTMDQLPNSQAMEVIKLSSQQILVPGMIDIHIHGVDGGDVMDATPNALQTMATALPREGTTAFYATTITQEASLIEQAVVNAAHYISQQESSDSVAECMGIHLEGPFISKIHKGAQPPEHIVPPNIEQFKQWQKKAKNHINLVTLAPEEENGYELVSYLRETGVIASIGHSDATYAQVRQAIACGASHVTHLYNAMRGLHHREPGVVGASFLSPELMVELIVDGIHSDAEMVRLALKNVGSERLILITDAMRAKCLKAGNYEIGGQAVYVSEVDARLASGALAGSILAMNDGFAKMMQFSNCSLLQAVRMSSYNAAKELNILDRKGSIAVGKDADLVILDQEYQVERTFCRGQLSFERR